MLRYFFSLMAFVVWHTAWTQTESELRSLSLQQLQDMKMKAIEQSDFLKADQINNEIISRRTTADWRAELERNLKTAVDQEDYAQASDIKLKIKSVDRLEELEQDLSDAISKDDFTKASQIKSEKDQILLYLTGKGSVTKSINSESQDVSVIGINGTVSVTFGFPPNSKKTGFFIGADVLIDGIYYGYFDLKNKLKIDNLPSGNHILEFHLTGFPANERRAFYSEEFLNQGKNYLLTVKSFSVKEQRKLMKNNVKLSKDEKMGGEKIYILEENVKSDSEVVAQRQEFNNTVFPTSTMTSGTVNYINLSTSFSGYKKPENADGFFALNLQEDFTVPVKDGFIVGGGFGFSFYNYSFPIKITRGVQFFDTGNDFTREETIDAFFNSYAFNANFLFGYQLELTEFFTVQSYISAGPGIYIGSSSTPIQTTSAGFSSVAYDYKIDYTSNTNVSFGGFWGTKAFYFFNKKQLFGISGGLAVGFSGGVGGNVGIVVGTFKPKYRSKYYNYAN